MFVFFVFGPFWTPKGPKKNWRQDLDRLYRLLSCRLGRGCLLQLLALSDKPCCCMAFLACVAFNNQVTVSPPRSQAVQLECLNSTARKDEDGCIGTSTLWRLGAATRREEGGQVHVMAHELRRALGARLERTCGAVNVAV